MKTQIVKKMITLPPWNRLPLHIRLFSSEAERCWLGETGGKGKGKDKGKERETVVEDPITRKGFTVIRDFAGVHGDRGKRDEGVEGINETTGLVDVDDRESILFLLITSKP